MLKRNIFKILAVVFFLLSGATFYNSNKNIPIKPTRLIQLTPTKSTNNNILGREDRVPTTYSISPTQAIVNPTNAPFPTSAPLSASPTSAVQYLKVSLSVGSSSIGTIEVTQGANQCDVLTQALSQGKIQSLNMRYNNDMGTNAVYQINGVGKENAVWWTFKVNGSSPSQGCSYIKVASGDNVIWEYVGS